MNRKTLFIILAAILVVLLVGLIWFFFFRASTALPPNTGTFGTGGNRPGNTGTTASSNNGVSSVPTSSGNQDTAGTGVGTNGGNTNQYTSLGNPLGGPVSSVDSLQSVPGVDWLGGNSPGSGATTNFIPKTVNQLNSGNVSGSPSILPTAGGLNPDGDNPGSILGPALLVAGLGTALCTAGLLPGVLAGTATGVAPTAATAAVSVPVNDIALNLQTVYANGLKSNDTLRENFLNCMTRTVAKAAVQQITASIVNWINSGFNGQPSFVKNYKQFFTNVADQAAGEYIRGSGLAFLCTNFKAQIRVALAQSYAKRGAQSCTLSSVIKNVNAFSNNFNQGGWAGMLAFTGMPTNNAFGAFSYAQAGLASAQASAINQKQQDFVIGKGFLSSTKEVCTGPLNLATGKGTNCKKETVTPGSTIADSLSSTLNVSKESLTQAGISGSFDAIISALISQLMVKALQGGVSNLSGTQGYAADYLTPEQQKAQEDAQTLLTNLQARVNVAQQYGTIKQNSIGDIQNTQSRLQGLVNCYELGSRSEQASTTLNIVNSYNQQIDALNDSIVRVNESISLLQDLQTDTIGITSAADVEAVVAAYNRANAQGMFVTEADVTTAQQDRTTLQASLSSRNTATDTELAQCNAF